MLSREGTKLGRGSVGPGRLGVGLLLEGLGARDGVLVGLQSEDMFLAEPVGFGLLRVQVLLK
ncbi:hypothetical protein [Microbacterium oleivorans]|uniref:Uncharacterized protein n=1 Tax=Microbacterium oleivorans TaxID=273677 RepID=A0A177K9H9_9MICO|nr:hypothetical protein AYL44_11615 [Microbacterium oleivorans]